MIGLINENIRIRNVEIGKIEILPNFSFFEIDKNYTDKVLEGFKNSEFKNRKIIVEQSGGGAKKQKKKKKGRRYSS